MQFEELQATMERVRAQGTQYPPIGMGHVGKSANVQKEAALLRCRRASGVAIPGRTHPGSPAGSKPAAKEGFSFVTALGSADWSLPATANDPQRANLFPAVVKVVMADDATVIAETSAIGSAQYFNAVAHPGVLTEQQCAALVLLLDGLPNKVIAQHD